MEEQQKQQASGLQIQHAVLIIALSSIGLLFLLAWAFSGHVQY